MEPSNNEKTRKFLAKIFKSRRASMFIIAAYMANNGLVI